jgi:hypothetical protein
LLGLLSLIHHIHRLIAVAHLSSGMVVVRGTKGVGEDSMAKNTMMIGETAVDLGEVVEEVEGGGEKVKTDGTIDRRENDEAIGNQDRPKRLDYLRH